MFEELAEGCNLKADSCNLRTLLSSLLEQISKRAGLNPGAYTQIKVNRRSAFCE